ncbi:MAG: RNA-binding S4 domain-containing protein [Burkholderiales bacterium]|nr:RNA-binding S4 domain-containing protein [Burkholderiales bacterium]
MTQHTFQLDKEFVELHVLLKLLALAPSGGAAKAMIAAGQVSVDGVVETRKACKIRANQVVRVADDKVCVVVAGSVSYSPPP